MSPSRRDGGGWHPNVHWMFIKREKTVTFTFKSEFGHKCIEHVVVVVALRAVFDFISFAPGSVATCGR